MEYFTNYAEIWEENIAKAAHSYFCEFKKFLFLIPIVKNYVFAQGKPFHTT